MTTNKVNSIIMEQKLEKLVKLNQKLIQELELETISISEASQS